MSEEIYRSIPHRPPFLFVDEIVSMEKDVITTLKRVRADEPHFEGHYPGNPIMPGVLLCESVFQTGAILLVNRSGTEVGDRTPVLTRIKDARFKNIVRPGEELTIRATLRETHGPFCFLDGIITSGEKKVLTIHFGLALLEREGQEE